MGPETEVVKERLKSSLAQLRTEFGVLDRIVYKNKNQHRRSSYFQFLLKVRRVLRLLQSANLEEILNSCFLVINEKRPKQKVQLLESLKRRRSDGGKHNFQERLLGVAHLLSQMVEPMLKAAIEISTLLGQSFFLGFSLTILALLARFRVSTQQAFREYYPIKDQPSVLLECIWQTDKYVLVEKINGSETQSEGKDIAEAIPLGASTVQYQSMEVLLKDNEHSMAAPNCAMEGPDDRNNESGLSAGPLPHCNEEKQVKDRSLEADSPSNCSTAPEGGSLEILSSALHPNPLKRKHESKGKVASVSVKVPAPSRADKLDFSIKGAEKIDNKKEDEQWIIPFRA